MRLQELRMDTTRLVILMWASACVVMISAGQLLFKITASRLHGTWLPTAEAATVLALALGLYAIATVVWILVLRHVSLSSIYPLMALSFVLVPLGSRLFLGEAIAPQYWGGVALLVAGLIVIERSVSAD
jgi:drug/metabolite transporter (DMT)-like permease